MLLASHVIPHPHTDVCCTVCIYSYLVIIRVRRRANFLRARARVPLGPNAAALYPFYPAPNKFTKATKVHTESLVFCFGILWSYNIRRRRLRRRLLIKSRPASSAKKNYENHNNKTRSAAFIVFYLSSQRAFKLKRFDGNFLASDHVIVLSIVVMTRTRKCRFSLSFSRVVDGRRKQTAESIRKGKISGIPLSWKNSRGMSSSPPTHHRAISENIQNSTPVPSFSLPSFFFFFEHHKLDVVNISSLCSGNTSPTRPPPPYSILALLVLSLSLSLSLKEEKEKERLHRLIVCIYLSGDSSSLRFFSLLVLFSSAKVIETAFWNPSRDRITHRASRTYR